MDNVQNCDSYIKTGRWLVFRIVIVTLINFNHLTTRLILATIATHFPLTFLRLVLLPGAYVAFVI
jgi:hypothetical protein